MNNEELGERVGAGIMFGFPPAFIGFLFGGVTGLSFFFPGFLFGFIIPDSQNKPKMLCEDCGSKDYPYHEEYCTMGETGWVNK